ncbi:MAG: hypothetical protein JWQ98_108 [Chlorobi bacterium]|nr:hypothetical protein [Chlorobiota bacterium]
MNISPAYPSDTRASFFHIGRGRFSGLLVALLLVATAAAAQVNTEFLRRDSVRNGLHGQLGFTLAYQSGNSNFLTLAANGRIDWHAGALYTFLVANYERGRNDNDLFQNDGFLHLRLVYTLDSAVKLELFAQKEFNDFILLHDRQLAGAGVRLRVFQTVGDSGALASLNVGVGGMFESELVDDPGLVRTSLVRSTNYLSFLWRINSRLGLNAVGYYQPALSRRADYRLLGEGGLAVALSDLLALTINVHYRFDNEPPVGVRRFDLGITNGLAVQF